MSRKSSRTFQLRKVESLDWKKIASLDIEKIIEDADEAALREILPQIAFCQPDVEFDHNKTDPGFRKVFRLGQLIIEQLVQAQDAALEKASVIDSKYNQVVLRSRDQEEEIKRLRSRLLEVKKELKRRKALIESNQIDFSGRSKEEFEQCPYCDKKFMNSVFLYSHLQRRHQGLPVSGLPSKRHSASAILPGTSTQDVAKGPEKSVAVAWTQTDDTSDEPPPLIDRQILNDLIQDCLKESIGSTVEGFLESSALGRRSEGQWPLLDDRHISQDNLSASAGNVTAVNVTTPRNDDTNQGTVEVMKDALENQWRTLIEKMHKTELEELKATLLEEMRKMQEIIVKSTTKVAEGTKPAVASMSPNVAAASPSSILVGRVEERIQKQENEFEHLKLHLQTKIRADIDVIESRMESQERFWRAKLRTVENEYQDHISQLRQEFQATLQANQTPLQPPQVHAPKSPAKVTWPTDEAMMVKVKPPTPSNSVSTTAVVGSEEPEMPQVVPTPKPRNAKIQTLPRAILANKEENLTRVTGLPPKPPMTLERNAMLEAKVRSRSLNLAEAQARAVSPESSSSTEDSSSVGTYSIVPQKPKVAGSPKSTLKDVVTMTSTDVQTETDNNDGVRPFVRNANGQTQVQAPGLVELNHQLQELGIRPEATQLPRKAMKKSLKTMQKRRKSLNEKLEHFAGEREKIKVDTEIQGNIKSLEIKLNDASDARRLSIKPLPPPPSTPLAKMFRVVRSGGNTLKRKMSLMTSTRKPKVKNTSPKIRLRASPAAVIASKSRPASRKSAPPPPPPVVPSPKTSPIAVKPKKKKHGLKSLFRRGFLRKKIESESESEVDPEMAKAILKRSRPAQFSSTPTPKHRLLATSPFSANQDPPDPGQNVIPDEAPDRESHEIGSRMNQIQRKAMKEIELGKHGVLSRGNSPIPGPVETLHNRSSDSEDEIFAPYKAKLHSSMAINGEKDLDFQRSASSVNDDSSDGSTDDASEIESEEEVRPMMKSARISGEERDAHAPMSNRTKVETIIHHVPMAGLNKYGLKETRQGSQMYGGDSDASVPGTSNGGIQRLQRPPSPKRQEIYRSSNQLKISPVLVQKSAVRRGSDALNNSSDWDASLHETNVAGGKQKDRKSNVADEGDAHYSKDKKSVPESNTRSGPLWVRSVPKPISINDWDDD